MEMISVKGRNLAGARFAQTAKTCTPNAFDLTYAQKWGPMIMARTFEDIRKEAEEDCADDPLDSLFVASRGHNIALRFIYESGLLAHFNNYLMSNV